jgi:predicted TIM-barrel fold metal-dependent hydrolase
MIIDTHTHIFPAWLQERRHEYLRRDATFGELYNNPRSKLATVEELIAEMDASGVDVAVLAGIGWSDEGLAKDHNDYLLEAAQQVPNRLVAFCGVNPAWGDRAVKEIARCAGLGAKGVGELHPDTQGFNLGDKALMSPVMEVIDDLELVLLTHSSEPVGHPYSGKGATTPNILMQFINHFPNSVIVCAHWGGGLPFYTLMPEVREALKNVYFDCAASPLLYNEQIFNIASLLIPPSRILMGTDYPIIPQTRILEQLRSSQLNKDIIDDILGGNALNLLNWPIGSANSPPKNSE